MTELPSGSTIHGTTQKKMICGGFCYGDSAVLELQELRTEQ
jgi:hypothetical protein